jgi:hypothetical protein
MTASDEKEDRRVRVTVLLEPEDADILIKLTKKYRAKKGVILGRALRVFRHVL